MDAERWKRVDDLLQSALQVSTGQQEEFLGQACAGDPALLLEVQSLLAAQSQMQLARVALEQGNASEAEGLARGSAQEFDRQKAVDNACSSDAILGQALLVQGKLKEAQTASDVAVARCEHGQDRGARFQAAIAGAAIKFNAGGTVEALNMLEKAHAEAEAARSGYVGNELETRLLMGDIEIKSGRKASGRSRLETLQKDAQSKQFGLTARKARSALDNGAFEF
jgi:hypothetical protein